jgi:hypothetical protein
VLSADRLAVSVADATAAYPVRIDPTFSDANWVSLNPGISGANYIVHAIEVDGSGNLYVGGEFTWIGTVPANYIAKWDGTTWSALGSGMGGLGGSTVVQALAVSGTNLYVGGWFTTAGGVTVNGIAKWDGNAWSALGSGMAQDSGTTSGGVYALTVSGTNIYAGGQFTAAGGVTANYIAKWDGSTWSALGSGMDGVAGALAVSGTNLYAGGGFTTAGGAAVSNIAKWDGSTWSSLGSGVNSYVHALAISGTNLFAGGGFGIAKWNGVAWSALGSGINGSVAALAVSGTDLYAGGNFTTAGGAPGNYLAKWDGSAWSALGSGVNSYVNALAIRGTNIYAGGYFTTAGGVTANYIAKWDGSTWSALGSGMNGSVNALAADGVGHLFVGGEFSMAGTNVSPYIAQANVGSAPAISMPPPTQTAEAGATAHFAVDADGEPLLAYQWYFNGTNLLSCTSSNLVLTNTLFSQSGSYTVVVTNLFGAVTSAPAMLNVITAVERRPAAGVQLIGAAGSLLNVEYANSLSATPNWLPLDTVTLVSTSQYCFDVSEPLPPQRFYRAWKTGTPGVRPSLDLQLVPAITLTGNLGDSVRLDYIKQFGPIDAWVTLATVTLTNTSQLYFDVSALGQPQRLYRIVPLP